MAWNTGGPPLHGGVLPPFLYRKGLHNEWLVNEVISSELRFVVDATSAAFGFYLGTLDPQFDKLSSNSSNESSRTWENGGNQHLASLYGSFHPQPNYSLPIRLVKCLGRYFLLDLFHDTFYSLDGPAEHVAHGLKLVPGQEQKPWLSTMFLQSWRQRKWFICIEAIHSLERESPCSNWHKVSFKMPVPLGLPYSLESLLQVIADKNKSVVLAVAGDNYRDMLMSWVCRLRHLAIMNFIVCALDPDIYQFSVLQV